MKRNLKNTLVRLILPLIIILSTENLDAQVRRAEEDVYPKFNTDLGNYATVTEVKSYESKGSYRPEQREAEERREAEEKDRREKAAEESRRFVRETEERLAQERAEQEERRKREEEENQRRIEEENKRKRKAEQEAQAAAERARVAAEQARIAQEAHAAAERIAAEQARVAAEQAKAAQEAAEQARIEQELRDLEKLEAEETMREQADYGEIIHFEVDAPHLAQELNNFNAIFTGLQAPDMEFFNNLMSSFMGKGGSSEADDTSTIPFDPNMAGDYLLTSFKYQDTQANVFMEIARVIKVSDCEIPSGDDDLTWNDLPDHPMTLSSINVSQENGEVTFAFYDQDKKVLLKTDVSSMNNYVTQKNIESYIFFNPTPASMPQIDFETFPMWGLKDYASSFGRNLLSALIDFTPWVGSSKALTELLYGVDAFTGQPVSRLVSAFALVGSVVPIAGTAKAAKFVGEGVEVGAKMLDKGIEGIEQVVRHAVTSRSTPGKATGGHTLRYIQEGETWLRGTASNAGKVPKQIADKLRDLEFKSWNHFRRTFWKEVANDPVLCKSFDVDDLLLMNKGYAPEVVEEQFVGKLNKYTLHHINPIHNGGKVYNIDNIMIVTPRYHQEMLDPNFHFNRKK